MKEFIDDTYLCIKGLRGTAGLGRIEASADTALRLALVRSGGDGKAVVAEIMRTRITMELIWHLQEQLTSAPRTNRLFFRHDFLHHPNLPTFPLPDSDHAASQKLSTLLTVSRRVCAASSESCYSAATMAKQPCSICSAPPDVAAAVNESLRKQIKLRDLEKSSGFSRATLSRHSIKCIVRDTIANFKNKNFNPYTDKIFVQWPGGQPIAYGLNAPIEMAATDWLIEICYAAPVPERLLSRESLPEAITDNENSRVD